MNERQFGNKIRQALNERAAVDASVSARLEAARAHALARQRAERVAAPAAEPRAFGDFGGLLGVSLRMVLPLVLVVGALAGLYVWQQKQRVAEIAAIDAKLLAGKLPIDAYIDKGFEAWLKTHAPG